MAELRTISIDEQSHPLILEGVVGSRAYGLNTPESDYDYSGIFVAPTADVLSLWKHKTESVKNDGVDKTENPDKSYHEVEKFLRLTLDANPTVTELLWLNDYTHLDQYGKLLVEARTDFLSTRIRKTYVGYAKGQLDRFFRLGFFDPDLKKRAAKHARHIWRLLIQAEHALNHGEILVRLTQGQRAECFGFAEGLVSSVEDENLKRLLLEQIAHRVERIDAINTSLPDEPNREVANDLLLLIRSEH